MRFKKLELLGFKSFAEPTELTFEPGITAVVGPNGCGKSNIADAIKWVLGEQSARELRGGRMEDLIFNGSDRREPIHYAEVSLTLDNADKKLPIEYTEVTISRRLFRTGESEYLLNKTPVRLKDIHELLMGTGIGTSAYSLFEQGRIEQIISARPEERRAVFEEAAGITKFKTQKREALRKLDETEANLARVGDVIAEVKRQIQAMERQVRRAKAYQEQFEQLKFLELTCASYDQRRIRCQWEEKEAALQGLKAKAAELEKILGGQEERLCSARDAVARADDSLHRARESHLALTHRRETLHHRLEVSRERLAEAANRQSQIVEECAAAQANLLRLQGQQSQLQQVVTQTQAQRQSKEALVAQALRRLDECARTMEESSRAIAKTQERLLDETGRQVQLKNEHSQLHQQVTRLEARLTRLTLEGTKVSAERTEAASQVQHLEESFQTAQAAADSAGHERDQAREKLAATESSLATVRQEIVNLEQELAKVQSQLELLRGLLVSHEGYASGVKTLLTALDEGRIPRDGINGVLAELIQVAPEDTAAVDAALGPWAQAVVVESSQVAQACRQMLEKWQAGRVLFLICNQIPEGNGRAPVSGVARAVPLFDRVGITPHLSPLLKLLLADTWLLPDRPSAEDLPADAIRRPFGTRFVTSSGELYMSPGALLGSAPLEEGLVVGRASRLQSLEVAHAHLMTRLEERKSRLQLIQEEHGEQKRVLETLEVAFQEKAKELHRLQVTLSSVKEILAKLEDEDQLLKTEEAQAQEELRGLRQEEQELQAKLAEKNEQLAALQSAIEESEAAIREATELREETSVTLATAKAELASFDEVAASRQASLRLLEETIKTQDAQLAALAQELNRLKESQIEHEADRQELELSVSGCAEEETQAVAQVTGAEKEKREILEAAHLQEREFLTVSRQMEQLQSQLHALEMEQAQLAFQREQMANRLAQVYQVTLEESSGDLPERFPEEIEKSRSQIAELSQKLQRLGPVNLSSIDEERELQGRYEYLVTQQSDLTRAKEDLHEAITKINRTTRAMFRETFQAIQQEFQVTFKQLFGGGEARLVLLDEEDLLESGIEIIARPPGKPIQAISLLSGGEKALTTIALLFAIFRVKPSPFCLLDEIDAPLDETNVGRFTGALREFLKESQFIIITHNKRTITMADVMYGVTMEESGVSKIVSVKFKDQPNGNGAHGMKVAAGPAREATPRTS